MALSTHLVIFSGLFTSTCSSLYQYSLQMYGNTVSCAEHVSLLCFFNRSTAPWGPMPPHFSRLHNHTLFRHTTLGTTPLDEGPARRRDLYLTTHKNHKRQTDIHASGGIRTHDPSKRAAADPRFRPRGHWDRHHTSIVGVMNN
jgi:hypothetical protein